MNFKIIQFKCSCKFIWLNNTKRKYKVCPKHGRPTLKYILWCGRCGEKVEANAWAGYRQQLCLECRRITEREASAKWWKDHKKEKKKKRKKKLKKLKITPNKTPAQARPEAEAIIAKCADEMRQKYLPPKEGMI